MRTVEGGEVAIEFDSVCIHSDTPGALDLVKATRQALAAAGVKVVNLKDALQANQAAPRH